MFDNYYEVFLADTRESKEINYSIRYRIYCEEMGFENKDNFPRKQEFDDHDHHAAHFIVRHKLTGDWVGAMRLIFQNDQPLPIVQHCNIQEEIDKADIKPAVELSRLCVLKEVRRNELLDISPPDGTEDEIEVIKETYKKINRSIIWGLFNAIAEYSYLNNIGTWYFITTTAMTKILRKGGLKMLSIGAPCYHNGERYYPFKKNVIDTYHNEAWRKNYTKGYRKFSELEA